PLLPTSADVRGALDGTVKGLEKAGVTVARSSPLLPNLAVQGRTFSRLLSSVFGADISDDIYARVQERARSLPADDVSLPSERLRGTVLSHRDWIRADRFRNVLSESWRALFRAFDVVLCPVMPTVAFPHDHSERAGRRITIDNTTVPYFDQLMWAG